MTTGGEGEAGAVGSECDRRKPEKLQGFGVIGLT
jgi:hypothetical protein